ncbi:MAG: hypothetical protein AB1458_05740 [Bacteroidota bacterium]
MKQLLLLTFLPLFAFAQPPDYNLNTIKFIQGDSTCIISGFPDSITLDKKPFALRYYCKVYNSKKGKFYSAQVAILDNATDTAFAKVGQKLEDIPYFQMGTGFASIKGKGYDTAFVSASGHHYLFYENEKDKRVTRVATHPGGVLELEWRILALNHDGENVSFHELRTDNLYFVIFIDQNLNGVIDKSELKIMKIKFR